MATVGLGEEEYSMDIKSEVLCSFKYDFDKVNKGYTDKTLYINLSDNKIISKPVPKETKDKFIGGRGYGLKYLWDAVRGDTKWDDEENEIIVSPGPISGITQYPGIGKSIVVSISPLTGTVVDSNVGGYFGPLMKFSGWDALEIQGKAEADVIIFIDGDNKDCIYRKIKLRNRRSTYYSRRAHRKICKNESDKRRRVSVISAGVGAENTNFGILNFSFYDLRRKCVRIKQAGRGGIGSVFRDKR